MPIVRRPKHSTSRGRRWLRVLISIVLATVALAGAGVLLYQRGYIHFNNPSKAELPVRGIDVSSFQRTIDWPTLVQDSHIRFAFIKASEGAQVQDKRFRQNWAGARGLVARSGYHFFTFCTPGESQATNFLDVLPPTNTGELPPAVDVEFGGNCKKWKSIAAIRTELQIFLTTVQQVTRRTPILYVTAQSYERIIRGFFDAYPLWVQNVVSRPTAEQYPRLRFWQYAGNGRLKGINGIVDLNVFVGKQAEFDAMLRRGAVG